MQKKKKKSSVRCFFFVPFFFCVSLAVMALGMMRGMRFVGSMRGSVTSSLLSRRYASDGFFFLFFSFVFFIYFLFCFKKNL